MAETTEDMSAPSDAYEIIDHTADWALRVRGRDLTELFRNAAQGMAELIGGEAGRTLPDEARSLVVESSDAEGLLVAWLGELAYWAERDGFVGREFEIDVITMGTLTATVRGRRLGELQKHIKAVTYHDLAIRTTDTGLEVTVVFDV